MTEEKYGACRKCCGMKKIAPLGGMQIECPVCLGVGFAKIEDSSVSAKNAPTHNESVITHNESTTVDLIDKSIVKIKKKPGRKPGSGKVKTLISNV